MLIFSGDYRITATDLTGKRFVGDFDGTIPVDLKTLHAKIGQLALENDFLSGALGKAGLLSGKK